MTADKNVWSDLVALAAMDDREIDLSDASETIDFTLPKRGIYDPLQRKEFDVRAIANWFVDRAKTKKREISKVWINKLVFLAYEKGIQDFGIVLTPARAEAWNYGPVFREVYFQYDDLKDIGYFQRFNVVGRKKIKVEAEFGPSDLSILEFVWDHFADFGAKRLTEITHAEGTPWQTVWDIGGEANPGMAITPAIIMGRKGGYLNGNR